MTYNNCFRNSLTYFRNLLFYLLIGSMIIKSPSNLKLVPYRQSSLGQGKTTKLSPRYAGPFRVSSYLCESAQEFEPEAILARSGRKLNNRAATVWLIKWKGKPVEEASWEFASELQIRFPSFNP